MTVTIKRAFLAATAITAALLAAAPASAQQGMPGWDILTGPAGASGQGKAYRDLLSMAYRHASPDPTDPLRQGTNMGKPGFNDIVATGLEKAQKALAAGNYLQARAGAILAQGAVTNDYEKLKVYQFLIYADLKTDHREAAVNDAIAAADLATISNDERRELYTDTIVLSFNSKNYARALDYARRMQALNLKDPLSQQAIGQALYYGGDNAQAQTLLQKLVADAMADGQTPSESLLGILVSAQAKGYAQPDVENTLSLLGANYDKPFYWQSMVDFAFFKPDLRDLDKVWLGRLMFASGSQISQQNADRIGQAAFNLGLVSAEARWQDIGAKGYTVETAKLAADEESMPQQIMMAGMMDGAGNARLAESLYDYAQFSEAEAAARRAIAKGTADPSEPAMMLGMALYAQGKYADAATAFGKVTGGGAGTANVAHLWATLAKNKTKAPATTSAALTK